MKRPITRVINAIWAMNGYLAEWIGLKADYPNEAAASVLNGLVTIWPEDHIELIADVYDKRAIKDAILRLDKAGVSVDRKAPWREVASSLICERGQQCFAVAVRLGGLDELVRRR